MRNFFLFYDDDNDDDIDDDDDDDDNIHIDSDKDNDGTFNTSMVSELEETFTILITPEGDPAACCIEQPNDNDDNDNNDMNSNYTLSLKPLAWQLSDPLDYNEYYHDIYEQPQN